MVNSKTDVRWLKIRNTHGQVVVAYTREDDSFRVGASFCSPLDFGLPRAARVNKGCGIAIGRHASQPAMVTLQKDRYTHEEFRLFVLDEIAADPYRFGVKSYQGEAYEAAFMKWFIPFMKEARA